MHCGVGDYTARLTEALADIPGSHIAVLTDELAKTTDSRIELIPTGRWTLRRLPYLLRAIRKWRPDIVHVQFPTQGYFGYWLPWFFPALLHFSGYRIVQTWHEYTLPWQSIMQIINTHIINMHIINGIVADGIVVVRPGYREKLSPLSRWTIRRKPFQLIPNGSSLPSRKITQDERDDIRKRFGAEGKFLVAYFGFLYPHKGVDLIFRIADPAIHSIVLIGEIKESDPYHRAILDEIHGDRWKGSALATGFLPPSDAALILAAADAVVFPSHIGYGEWNSSVHAAGDQGAFVLTTSDPPRGYVPEENIYYAHHRDIVEMREALNRYIGTRADHKSVRPRMGWKSIAEEHLKLYHLIMN